MLQTAAPRLYKHFAVPYSLISREYDHLPLPINGGEVFRVYPETKQGLISHADRLQPFDYDSREHDIVIVAANALLESPRFTYRHVRKVAHQAKNHRVLGSNISIRAERATNRGFPHVMSDLVNSIHLLALANAGKYLFNEKDLTPLQRWEEAHEQIGEGDTFCHKQVLYTLQTKVRVNQIKNRLLESAEDLL